MDSFWILSQLKGLDLLKDCGDDSSWWWPNAGSFEVVIGAILVQNTKWENAQISLQNLKSAHILSDDNQQSLENLAQCTNIESLIVPSGFFRQKSSRILNLAKSIRADFEGFDLFCENVSREWLLSQKGIGFETADAILNYACKREIMVVDKYSFKLLASLGIQIDQYDDLQAWFMDLSPKDVAKLYGDEISMAQVYARYHGKIVAFSRNKMSLHFKDTYI